MRSGRLLVLAAMASFGALAFFAKVALRAGVTPLTFLVGRFSLASVLLVFTLSVTRPSRPARRDVWLTLGLGALVYAGQAVALTYALTEGDASVVAVLFATYPALVVLGIATTRGLTAIGRCPGWLAIVGAGALSTAFAFLVLFAALPRTGPVTAGIVLGAEPVVTVLLGVTVLGDHVTVAQGIGFALVIGSVALLAAATSRRPPVPAA